MRWASLAVVLLAGCTWSNSLYQAKSLSSEAARAERGGRPAEADGFWNQAAIKAESALVRSPNGRNSSQARWLLGRALARARDCDRGRPYLENALTDAPHATWNEALQLELARCIETTDTARAAAIFASLKDSRDAATRREAREHAGRGYLATGHADEAIAMLRGIASPVASLDRAVALAMLDHPDSALVEVRPLLDDNDAGIEWDRLIVVLAASSSDAVDRLLATLGAMPRQTPQELNNWRLAALRGTRLNDTLTFNRRLATLQAGPPGPALTRGRVLAAERAVGRVRNLAALVQLRDSLARSAAPAGDLVAVNQWTHLRFLVGRVTTESAAAPDGVPQGDMVHFALAELARDSLHSTTLAEELFVRIEHGWPRSAYLPKSLFARIWLTPDSADVLRARAGSYSTSPYLAFVRGVDQPGYRRLEDSLATFVRDLAARAARNTATDTIR